MHDYVCFIAPIDHCVEFILIEETLWKLLLFHTEMIAT